MNSAEQLLGFDAREMQLKFDTTWSLERKSQYLLRTDIIKPLSTDVLVWPTALHADESLTSPFWDQTFRLWNDLSELRQHLRVADDLRSLPVALIGITLLTSVLSEQEQAMWSPLLLATKPATVSNTWNLLGYDVSDMALLSGLSNCGYEPRHIHSLRKVLAPFLNEFHLFIDTRKASEFKVLTNLRVAEHAPFFVYGLYLVEQIDVQGKPSEEMPGFFHHMET